MSGQDHILNRRSDMLAAAISHQVDFISESLTPPGTAPAFTTKLSKSEAMNWWQAHWNDDLGRKARAMLPPDVELNLALSVSKAKGGEGG